jgi:hypothetical protein
MRDDMKNAVPALLLAASAALVGCSSTAVQPHRPVSGVPGNTSTPTGPAPTTTPGGSTASDPCAVLAGTPVGKETDPKASGAGELASPPTACASSAEATKSGRCTPAGKSASGHWFTFSSNGYTAFGKPGGTWHVKHGAFDQDADLPTIGC